MGRKRFREDEASLGTELLLQNALRAQAARIPIEANDEKYARVKVLREICRALAQALER